jgi:hypothetical protein
MVEDSRPDSEPITRIVREIVHVTQTPEEIAAEGEEPLLIEYLRPWVATTRSRACDDEEDVVGRRRSRCAVGG